LFLLFLDQLHGLAAANELSFSGHQHLNFVPADLAEINLTHFVRHPTHPLFFIRTQIFADQRRKGFFMLKILKIRVYLRPMPFYSFSRLGNFFDDPR
jgi:hypothetical protein